MASTYEPIATTTLGSSNTLITFSSIPSTYTDLVVVANFLLAPSTNSDVYFYYNNDQSSLYSYTFVEGTGSSAVSGRTTNQTKAYLDVALYFNPTSSNQPITSIIQVQNYSNSSTYKTALSRNSSVNTDTTAVAHLYRSTNAINRIDFGGTTFQTGTMITVYGIKAA
jgi:hypothetical protein